MSTHTRSRSPCTKFQNRRSVELLFAATTSMFKGLMIEPPRVQHPGKMNNKMRLAPLSQNTKRLKFKSLARTIDGGNSFYSQSLQANNLNSRTISLKRRRKKQTISKSYFKEPKIEIETDYYTPHIMKRLFESKRRSQYVFKNRKSIFLNNQLKLMTRANKESKFRSIIRTQESMMKIPLCSGSFIESSYYVAELRNFHYSLQKSRAAHEFKSHFNAIFSTLKSAEDQYCSYSKKSPSLLRWKIKNNNPIIFVDLDETLVYCEKVAIPDLKVDQILPIEFDSFFVSTVINRFRSASITDLISSRF